MKKLAYILLIASAYTTMEATKYICSQNNMSDSVFTTVFATAEECRQYCSGICEETADTTDVDTLEVD